MTNTIQNTSDWFTIADKAINDKNPDKKDKLLIGQIAFHLEEVKETIIALYELLPGYDPTHLTVIHALENLKDGYLSGRYDELKNIIEKRTDKVSLIELIDGLGDTVVTAVGVMNRCGVNPVTVMDRINDSNYSKFDENGNPIVDETGKIQKGSNYQKPVLDDLI